MLSYKIYTNDGNIMMFSSDNLIKILEYIDKYDDRYSVCDIIKIELIDNQLQIVKKKKRGKVK